MSSISSISIRKPVLAAVMSIVIVIFGLIALSFLPIREYPVVESPVITVSTSYTGANAQIIQAEITEPLEDQINAVSGIRTLTSSSSEGRSLIRVEFSLDIDIENAVNDVRDRVSRALESLPADANPPSIRKEDTESDPIVFLNLSSDQRDRLELTQIARDLFRERLRTIDGISIISVWGQQRYTMRLWLDPALMTAYNVTPGDIRSVLDQENVDLPSGVLEGDMTELTIRTMGRMSEVEEFSNLIIREENGNVVRFRDVGSVELGTRDDRTILRRNGEPMVGIVAIPQPGSNQIAAADELFRRVDLIKQELPPDVEVSLGFDRTEFIRESISEVRTTIIIAFILVALIMFLFLREWRTTLIPVIVVPITLLGSFFVMFLFGFSINILTLLALVLAIGLVVDDAIIVLENIYAKMEAGQPAIDAGILGTREIFFAVIATSLALISVFTPIVFMDGITGRLFREFGLVIAGAVVISSFVALTLTPMLSTRILKTQKQKSRFYERTEPFFEDMTNWYKDKLSLFMDNRHYAFYGLAISALLIVLFFWIIPEEVAPVEDRSTVNVSVTGPEGATFEYMDWYMNQLTEVVNEEVPEAMVFNTVTSPSFGSAITNSGVGFLTLNHPSDRSRSQMEIADALSERLAELTGAQAYVAQPQTLSDDSGLPVQYVLQAQDFSQLEEVIPQFLEEARTSPVFNFVDVDLKFNKPEIQVEIDRNRARALGISVRDIAQTLQLAFSGSRYGFFTRGDRQYWVVGQLTRDNRNEPVDLTSLTVRNSSGDLIQLDNVVTLVEDSSPPELYRFNRLSSATVSASLAPGRTISDGIRAMDDIAANLLDENFTTELSGPSRDFQESVSSLNFIFALAIIFIYLVLAAQFESFRDPLIILLTVPLALFGALLSLWYFGETLNIFSKIGMVMLIGLVTKNGILIVEFANQRQIQGLTLMTAIKDAAASRFRPILMTSASTILGILPIALSLGAGSESRVSMGIAVIGGLLIGTFLTLFIIPAMYSYIAKERSHITEDPVFRSLERIRIQDEKALKKASEPTS
ncbi:MAG: efflux RND transporter permease subunit [Balneolia bacterium]|nr:efflux RND transporter permease subunit [Balneolia bacterium]